MANVCVKARSGGHRDGDDTLIGTDGEDTLKGLAGDDRLEGRASADVIQAGGGNDSLLGGTGGDRLVGHGGDDSIEGGTGDDRLGGGDGGDTFVFGPTSGTDTIKDFDVDADETVSFEPASSITGRDDITITESNNGTEITTPEGTIDLPGVDPGALTDDHFIY